VGTHTEKGRPRVTDVHDLVRDLLDAEPRLAPVYREHLADNDELLIHVLLGDVTRWLRQNGPAAAVLAVLERHLAGGDSDVQNAIAASFVENLEPDDATIHQALGPGLRAELQRQERWTPLDLDQPT